MVTGETATKYLRFANLEARGSSPVYEAWASGVAGDPDILALLDSLPAPKRQPNLAFAAARVHGAPAASYATFREHFVSHWQAIRTTMLASSTQTNEAARTSTLLPWLAHSERPIALLEVGASAGLCLYPDRYSHVYSDGVCEVRLDPADGPSEVELHCRVNRLDLVPTSMPDVRWRAGIDLKPIAVGDPKAMAWLRALVWPEHDTRRQRLAAAAKVVERDPPRLFAGDLLECLAETAAAAPREAQLVVFHSAVLNYLSVEARAAFMTAVRQLDAVWLANEGDGVLPWRAPSARAREGAYFVVARNGVPVGLASGHGEWLDWL
jgi:hypothetical protein